MKKMNGMREKAIVKDIEGGQVHFFKEDNKLVLIKDDIGLVIEPVNPAFKLNIAIGEKALHVCFFEGSHFTFGGKLKLC